MERLLSTGLLVAALCGLAPPAGAQAVAVADYGTADVGVGSQAVKNVAANDTVNGAPAVIGSNATLTAASPIPSGIAFNTSAGTVETAASLAQGTWGFNYQLCAISDPSNCSQTSVTVVVGPYPVLVTGNDSGTADAGISSQVSTGGAPPVALNVTSNDTINGAAVVLGANAKITQVTGKPWPTGLVFATATGAVTTTATLAAGTYVGYYQLCDLNSPAQCSSPPATVTVNVTTPNVDPVPDPAKPVTAGIAAKPILNVAANDLVNNVPAIISSSNGGIVNATVAEYTEQGATPWPAGITLNSTSGTIATTAAVPPGSYSVQYSLCDLNKPAFCKQATDTIVVNAALVANAESGTTAVGNTATVIQNIAAGDSVNNAAVVLTTPGVNATVSTAGTWPSAASAPWPAGITLNTSNGAVTVDSTVPAQTYSLGYQLCDLFGNCNFAPVNIFVTPVYLEQLANATPMGDIEFDWGRDGLNCPTCNFGDGNARANWTQRDTNPLSTLWIAHLNVATGTFDTPGANDELVDTWSTFWKIYGNGPEWTFSSASTGSFPTHVISQLVYSRVSPSAPTPVPNPPNAYVGAAYVTQTAYSNYAVSGEGGWSPTFFPGAITHGNPQGENTSNLPEGSQCLTDALPMAMYKNFASPLQLFTEPLSQSTMPLKAPFTSNGIGERFVPCAASRQLTFQKDVTVGADTFQQVFWYDVDTGAFDQLTFDNTAKTSAFMFKAPDFGDNYILFTLAKTSVGTTIQVYEAAGTNADGSPNFPSTPINSVISPDPDELYMNSAEPFINCTPTCRTYIFTTLAKSGTAQNGVTEPNGLAVVALDPNHPFFNILVSANSLPPRQRLDPEYYITPQGPYLYYNNIVPQTGSTDYKNLGEWFIDMQLGAPSGSCVGSSAESGLMPNC